MKEEIIREGMGLDDKFNFLCHRGLSCFTKCCQNINIFLTPYDILRMKKKLNISSTEFLEKYTLLGLGEKFGLPIIRLRPRDDGSCPFLGKDGCTIYEARPWSCRSYPLGRSAKKEKGKFEISYYLVKEPYCLGFDEKREWTVREWRKDQQIEVYDEMNDLFMELTFDERLQGGRLDKKKLDMFFMTCYDLDKFRRFVFETKFLDIFELEDEFVNKIKRDDVELMKLGFDWLKFSLLAQATLRVKDSVLEKRRSRKFLF